MFTKKTAKRLSVYVVLICYLVRPMLLQSLQSLLLRGTNKYKLL